jgi:hypothetical protein
MIKGVVLCFFLGLIGSFSPARAQGGWDMLLSTICYANPSNSEPCYAEATGYIGYVEVEIGGYCYYASGSCDGEPAADLWGYWLCEYVQPTGVVVGTEGTYEYDEPECGFYDIDFVESTGTIAIGGLIVDSGYQWQDCLGLYEQFDMGSFDCP